MHPMLSLAEALLSSIVVVDSMLLQVGTWRESSRYDLPLVAPFFDLISEAGVMRDHP